MGFLRTLVPLLKCRVNKVLVLSDLWRTNAVTVVATFRSVGSGSMQNWSGTAGEQLFLASACHPVAAVAFDANTLPHSGPDSGRQLDVEFALAGGVTHP